MKIVKRIFSSRKFIIAGSFILGVLLVLGIRFATYHPEKEVHYHANFAVYINGQREAFKGMQYYTEEGACTNETGASQMPEERAHMHDGINNVIHVEDEAVTWGQFFENLGWRLGPSYIINPDATVYAAGGQNKLHVIINSQDYTDLGDMAKRVIKDEDRLLISFGDISEQTLQQEYKSVPSTAHHYDVTPDPKSCSGHSSSTLRERMMHMF